MQNSVAIKDCIEGSLPNNRPLLPTTGWSLWGFEASTYNITQTQPYKKSTPHHKRYISIKVHPYAHPQHLEVLKHFVYIPVDVTDIPNLFYQSAYPSDGARGA